MRSISKGKRKWILRTKRNIDIKSTSQTEAKLLAELDALGNAWTQLEEQNSRKVLDLTSKEDELIKCHAERTKLEAKIITMQKQQSTLNNVALALKKQSDKQLEQIRRLEELEKSLLQQIAHLEREVSARQTLVDGHKRKNAELVQQFNESKERNERLNGKLGDVLSTLKEKVAALDSENRARRDMEEELAKVNKKLEVAKADPGAGDGGELSRQLEEYKALLKCPTCNKSFKDTILLKCMHTFCKTVGQESSLAQLWTSSDPSFVQCIDTIYDSRQRKCPTCGIAFGQSDVKPMYL